VLNSKSNKPSRIASLPNFFLQHDRQADLYYKVRKVYNIFGGKDFWIGWIINNIVVGNANGMKLTKYEKA
jgi:hypothetical protein